MKENNISQSQIDQIIITGGESRMTEIHIRVSKLFGNRKLNKVLNADEAVACGAAIKAYISKGGFIPGFEGIFVMGLPFHWVLKIWMKNWK